MKRHLLILAAANLALTGCQTVDEAATQNVEAICASEGYGPGSQWHDYCVSSLKPAAILLERKSRQRQFDEGVAMVARGLNPPQQPTITCVQTGNVTRCS